MRLLHIKLSDPIAAFLEHRSAMTGLRLSELVRSYIVSQPEFKPFTEPKAAKQSVTAVTAVTADKNRIARDKEIARLEDNADYKLLRRRVYTREGEFTVSETVSDGGVEMQDMEGEMFYMLLDAQGQRVKEILDRERSR